MTLFAAADLQRRPAEIQKAALKQPVFLSYHEKPRLVMMSLEEFVRMGGATVIARPECFPESVMARIRALEAAYPEEEVELVGDLSMLADDKGRVGDSTP